MFLLDLPATTKKKNTCFCFCFEVLSFLFMPCSSCFTALQNQAKLFIEQKKIPFPVDNQNINEELGKFSFVFANFIADFKHQS